MLYLAEEIVINALLFIFLDDLVLNHTWLKVEKSVNNIRQFDSERGGTHSMNERFGQLLELQKKRFR